MPLPLSLDLRKRIIEAKLRGDSESEIVSDTSVCKSTVTKLWALYRQTGSYAPRNPKKSSGRKPRLSPEQLEEVRQAICRQPRITLRELIATLHLPLSLSALHRIIGTKLKLRGYKKRRIPPDSAGKMR